jgi:uncharacterized repeat protein (TIGR03837 family)
VVRWDRPCADFLEERPRVVLECFACGRPEWLEEILFDRSDPKLRLIVSVEHLTAEDWAVELHRMPSATRSGLVKKSLFMPGFARGTGGLVVERDFCRRLESWRLQESRPGMRSALARTAGIELPHGGEESYWLTVFSYEWNYGRMVAELAAFNAERPLLAIVAAGRSSGCFIGAWERAGRPFPLVALPFLRQETWDEFLMASDFSIVRGEDSLARAALCGRPFLWQAYLQEAAHQVVKVKALLGRMRPHFPDGDFAAYEALSLAFNDRLADDPSFGGDESILPLLRRDAALQGGFKAFSAELLGLGNLAANLVTFIGDME